MHPLTKLSTKIKRNYIYGKNIFNCMYMYVYITAKQVKHSMTIAVKLHDCGGNVIIFWFTFRAGGSQLALPPQSRRRASPSRGATRPLWPCRAGCTSREARDCSSGRRGGSSSRSTASFITKVCRKIMKKMGCRIIRRTQFTVAKNCSSCLWNV